MRLHDAVDYVQDSQIKIGKENVAPGKMIEEMMSLCSCTRLYCTSLDKWHCLEMQEKCTIEPGTNPDSRRGVFMMDCNDCQQTKWYHPSTARLSPRHNDARRGQNFGRTLLRRLRALRRGAEDLTCWRHGQRPKCRKCNPYLPWLLQLTEISMP